MARFGAVSLPLVSLLLASIPTELEESAAWTLAWKADAGVRVEVHRGFESRLLRPPQRGEKPLWRSCN